jgi:glycosyltransferase involved in cell wall biosynthesis
VIVEAMAAALPVLATDKGAITESVIEGENGYIVKAHDPVDIAGKMERICLDAEKMKSMGRRSFEFYESKFTEEKMVENYVKCFKDLLGKEVNG